MLDGQRHRAVVAPVPERKAEPLDQARHRIAMAVGTDRREFIGSSGEGKRRHLLRRIVLLAKRGMLAHRDARSRELAPSAADMIEIEQGDRVALRVEKVVTTVGSQCKPAGLAVGIVEEGISSARRRDRGLAQELVLQGVEEDPMRNRVAARHWQENRRADCKTQRAIAIGNQPCLGNSGW